MSNKQESLCKYCPSFIALKNEMEVNKNTGSKLSDFEQRQLERFGIWDYDLNKYIMG